MDLDRVVHGGGLLLGSLLLSAGLAAAAISAAEESFVGVFLGMFLFVVGYRVAQAALAYPTDSTLSTIIDEVLEAASAIHLLAVLAGVAAIGYGTTLLFNSIDRTSLPLALAATALMFAGYATIHMALNRTLV